MPAPASQTTAAQATASPHSSDTAQSWGTVTVHEGAHVPNALALANEMLAEKQQTLPLPPQAAADVQVASPASARV